MVSIVAAGFVLSVQKAAGCWGPIAIEKLISESSVIVVGEVTKIINSPNTPSPENDAMVTGEKRLIQRPTMQDTAYITVSRVFKNTLPDTKIGIGDRIPLTVIASDSAFWTSIIIFDHPKPIGTFGIWIIEFKNNKYYAFHPTTLQPLANEEEIVNIINNQKNNP